MAIDKVELEVIDRQCSYGILSGIRYLIHYLYHEAKDIGFIPNRHNITATYLFARVTLDVLYETTSCRETRRTITFLYQNWYRFINKFLKFYETGRN